MLSAILARVEDAALTTVVDSLNAIPGATCECLMFDGCVVRRAGEAAKCVADILPAVSERIGLDLAIKPWSSPKFSNVCIAASLVLVGKAELDDVLPINLETLRMTDVCLFVYRKAKGRCSLSIARVAQMGNAHLIRAISVI